jgi:Skp family chaperone for outer membrane proteins
MNVSTRGVVALGLGVFGIGCLVGPSLGQRPTQAQDADVRKSANNTPSAATKPASLAFATVDIENVFKKYDKFKVQQEEFSAAAIKKKQELMKLQAEGQDEAAKLAKMVPNSIDAKKIEDHLTQLKAQIEATREQAQRDFSLRETEMLVQTYKEVQAMVAALAQHKGLTYVLKVSSNPITASNPDSVYAEMSKSVLYADPRNDLTEDVIYQLNARYKNSGGVAPKPAATARPAATNSAPPAAPSPRPAGNGNN